MNHTVENIQKLYDDSYTLYNTYVIGGSNSADSILDNLYRGIENLKNNWKGQDAGVQIANIVRVYNQMVAHRNALAQLAVDTSKIAAGYREIQIANSVTGLEPLNVIVFEHKTYLPEYSDVSVGLSINGDATNGKNSIDNASGEMDSFVASIKTIYETLISNWKSGPGRDNAIAAFDTVFASINNYKLTLSEASVNVATALKNYGG